MSPEEPPGPSTTTNTSIDPLEAIHDSANDILRFLSENFGVTPQPQSPDLIEVPKLALNDHKRAREKFKRFKLSDIQLDTVLKTYRAGLTALRKAIRDEHRDLCVVVPPSVNNEVVDALEAYWIRSRNDMLDAAIEATAQAVRMLEPDEIGHRTSFKTEFVPLFEYIFGKVQGYIRPVDKRHLASLSKMDYNQITIWFQNRRARLKKKEKDGKALPASPTLEETAAKLRQALDAAKPKRLRFEKQRIHLIQTVRFEDEQAIDMEENEYENEPMCARELAEAELWDRHFSGELPGLFDSLPPPPHYRLFPKKARRIPEWVTPSYGTAPWPRDPDAFPHIKPTPLAEGAIDELTKQMEKLEIQLWKKVIVKKRHHTFISIPEEDNMALAMKLKLRKIAVREDWDGATQTWRVKGVQTPEEADATLASLRQLQVQIDLTGLEDEDAAPEDQAQASPSPSVEERVVPTNVKGKGRARSRAPLSPTPVREITPDLEEPAKSQEQIAMELCDEMEDLRITKASSSDSSSQDSTSASDGEDTDSDDSSSEEETDSEDEGPNPLDNGPTWSRVCRVPTDDDDVPEVDMSEHLAFHGQASDFPPQLPDKDDPVLINYPLPRDPSIINEALKTLLNEFQIPLPANIDEEIVPVIIPSFEPTPGLEHLNYLGEIIAAVRKDFPLPEDADLAPVLPEQFPDLNWYNNNYDPEGPIDDPIMELIDDGEIPEPVRERTILSEMRAALGRDYVFEEVEPPHTVAIYDDWGNYVGERPRGTEPGDNEPWIVRKPRHPPTPSSVDNWIMANPFLQEYFGYAEPGFGINQEGWLDWLGREDEWAKELVCSMPTNFGIEVEEKKTKKRHRRKRQPPPPKPAPQVEDLAAYGESEMTYEECMDILAAAQRGVEEDEAAAQAAQEMLPAVLLDDPLLWAPVQEVPVIASDDEQFNEYLQSLLAQDPIIIPTTTDPLTDKLSPTLIPTDDNAVPSSSTDASPSPGFLQQFLDFASKLTDPAEYMWQQFINPDGY